MEIKILNNGDVKCGYSINLNNTIIELLNDVPHYMKKLNYKERYIQTLNDIISFESYILEKNKVYNNIQFAQAIKEYYSKDSTRAEYHYNFLVAI